MRDTWSPQEDGVPPAAMPMLVESWRTAIGTGPTPDGMLSLVVLIANVTIEGGGSGPVALLLDVEDAAHVAADLAAVASRIAPGLVTVTVVDDDGEEVPADGL